MRLAEEQEWLPARLRLLGDAVAVPLAAQVACAPVIVLLQGSITTVAVLANLLAAPLVYVPIALLPEPTLSNEEIPEVAAEAPIEASSARSQRTKKASPPALRMSAATRSPRSSLRPVTTT